MLEVEQLRADAEAAGGGRRLAALVGADLGSRELVLAAAAGPARRASAASSRSLMTFSGRYWSRAAVRM